MNCCTRIGEKRTSTKKYNNSYKLERQNNHMTVCIAAICENGMEPNSQKIVMCADRQVSTSLTTFESGISKIIPLTNYCYVMVSSNDSARTNMIIKNVHSKVYDKKLKIEEIVKIFSKEFQELFKTEREKEVLGNYGLNYKEFSEKSKDMNPILLKDISDSLIKFKTSNSEIIIVGLDPEPHIYVMDEKGDYSFEDSSGFAVVGSGTYLAFPEMTRHQPSYNPRIVNISGALIRVYRAKVVAQRVGGVGPTTDLAVLHLVNEEVNMWEVTHSEAEDSKKSLEILSKTIKEVNDGEVKILNQAIKELDPLFAKKVEEKVEPDKDVTEVKTGESPKQEL